MLSGERLWSYLASAWRRNSVKSVKVSAFFFIIIPPTSNPGTDQPLLRFIGILENHTNALVAFTRAINITAVLLPGRGRVHFNAPRDSSLNDLIEGLEPVLFGVWPDL